MSKPEPKSEVVIFSPVQTPTMLLIACYSEDARGWIRENAPLYGHFHETPAAGTHDFILHVRIGYDPVEVMNYLAAMPISTD